MVTQEQRNRLSTAHLVSARSGEPHAWRGALVCCSAQAQCSHQRAADDVARDCAQREDGNFHDGSLQGRGIDPQGCPALRAPRTTPQAASPDPPTRACGLRDCPADAMACRAPGSESQRPDDRTADDPTSDAASDDDERHGTSIQKTQRRHAPCGNMTAPAGLRNLPGQTNAPTCGASLPVYSANPFWGRGCHPIR